jgi:hypothetical protein
MYFRNGSKLSGMFIDDKADGYVEFEDSAGNIFQTENSEAKAMQQTMTIKRRKTVLIDPMQFDLDKMKFVPGSFTKCRLYHRGIINFKIGDKFRGVFKDGRPCGFGTMKYNYSLVVNNGSDYEQATYEG